MNNAKQSKAGIKWSWLAVSGISLMTGAVYLTAANVTGPAQVAQAPATVSQAE